MLPETPLPYGVSNEDGTIKQYVNECAITGSRIKPGDVTTKIAGTRYFYRLSMAGQRLFTRNPDLRAEIERRILEQAAPAEEIVASVKRSSRRTDEPTGDAGASSE